MWLDLSSCGLTSEHAEILYELVHHQSVLRNHVIWKASLREEIPSLDLMGGLRRLTLNDNDLGNALDNLLKALADDKWMKALDLQNW